MYTVVTMNTKGQVPPPQGQVPSCSYVNYCLLSNNGILLCTDDIPTLIIYLHWNALCEITLQKALQSTTMKAHQLTDYSHKDTTSARS